MSALTFRSCNHSAISTVVHNAFLATFAFSYFIVTYLRFLRIPIFHFLALLALLEDTVDIFSITKLFRWNVMAVELFKKQLSFQLKRKIATVTSILVFSIHCGLPNTIKENTSLHGDKIAKYYQLSVSGSVWVSQRWTRNFFVCESVNACAHSDIANARNS